LKIKEVWNRECIHERKEEVKKFLAGDYGANPLTHFDLGLLYKEQGKWDKALQEFIKATELSPGHSDAFRERGVAENKIFVGGRGPADQPTGENSLQKAVELNPEDFDAFASLGGVLKRQQRYEESFKAYRQATDLSDGDPYPLLNELKLFLKINHSPTI